MTGFLAVGSWNAKQVRRGGEPAQFAEAIKLSPAEGAHPPFHFPGHILILFSELGLCECPRRQHRTLLIHQPSLEHPQQYTQGYRHRTYSRTSRTCPTYKNPTPFAPSVLSVKDPNAPLDLDTQTNKRRALLLGVLHRTAGEYALFLGRSSLAQVGDNRRHLDHPNRGVRTCHTRPARSGNGAESEAQRRRSDASGREEAVGVHVQRCIGEIRYSYESGREYGPRSRLESRVAMLRGEIGYKKAALGL